MGRTGIRERCEVKVRVYDHSRLLARLTSVMHHENWCDVTPWEGSIPRNSVYKLRFLGLVLRAPGSTLGKKLESLKDPASSK